MSPLVAHNLRFDIRMLCQELRRWDIPLKGNKVHIPLARTKRWFSYSLHVFRSSVHCDTIAANIPAGHMPLMTLPRILVLIRSLSGTLSSYHVSFSAKFSSWDGIPSSSHRRMHGALVDAEICARIYQRMTEIPHVPLKQEERVTLLASSSSSSSLSSWMNQLVMNALVTVHSPHSYLFEEKLRK